MSTPKYTLAELRNLQEDDELDLSACSIKEFPNAIVQLTRLTKLDLSSNSLTVLPEIFCKMTKIVRLDFGNNQLHHLPDGIGYLTSLQHLNLYNNKLDDLPLSFANLKSLKWLDLKKNPLNSKLLAIAGNCGTDAECKTAAKQVVDVYMGERKKSIDNQKAQEAKMKAKVQKAQEEEKKRRYQEKKAKEVESQKEKDAKQRESGANSKTHHHQQSASSTGNAQQKAQHKRDGSPKGRKEQHEKKTQKPRGFICGLFSFIWTCVFYVTLILATSATVAIGLDCKGMGSPVPGNAPLCKDVTLMLGGNKPSAGFVQNVKKSYGEVFSGYHKQVKPHVTPAQKWISKQWSAFTKTDIGKKVEQILYQIHAFIVDTWVKVQRFVVKQWNAVAAWWKKDGQKQFGPALDGFMIGLKMVFQIVVDVARNIGALFVHLATRVKTFFLAWTDGGFQAAMNTLNH